MSSSQLVPHIPEEAPFNPAQRAWLNGFLAGLYSYAPAEPTSQPRLRIALLYGSQTGTAEGLARKLGKELRSNDAAGPNPLVMVAGWRLLLRLRRRLAHGQGSRQDPAQDC